jgi:hypothetical protein
MPSTVVEQQALCRKYGVEWIAAAEHLKVGISRTVRAGLQPLNGLRHPPAGDTTGWYLWAGEELSSAPDFFEPLHVVHLAEWCPLALRFLGLPPGWRFLATASYEDVWNDPTLLHVRG